MVSSSTKKGEKKGPPPAAPYIPPVIRALGQDDYADGTGFVRTMVLGATDTGKTRWASAWPRPLFLQCEPLVSIVRRRIDYGRGKLETPHAIQVKSSQDMLNAIEWVQRVGTKRGPNAELPKYQTVVVDTLDAFSRMVKEEWMRLNNAAAFTGYEAWDYLTGKLTTLLTRLLNTPSNAVVLCHWKDREITPPEGGNEKVTIYEPALQGQVKDSIFQDFSLIGWMDWYWVGSGENRVRQRGISFESNPQRPFLKNHYGIRPPERQNAPIAGTRLWWPVEINDGTNGQGDPDTFVETNFLQLWQAVIANMDEIEEGNEVERIPDMSIPEPEGAVPPGPGGPVPGAAAAAQAAGSTSSGSKGGKAGSRTSASSPATTASPASSVEPPTATAPSETAPSEAAQEEAASPVEPVAPQTAVAEQADGAATEPVEPVAEQADDVAPADDNVLNAAARLVEAELDGTVVEPTDGVDEPTVEGEAVADKDHCPICGKSLADEKRDICELSRMKHRPLVLPNGVAFWDTGGACYDCYQKINEQKRTKTGLYDPAENPNMAA